MTGRELAVRVLLRVLQQGAWASRALDAELADLSREERALATELVYGVLRHRTRLDRALDRCTRRGLGHLDAESHMALLVGAYQLLRLDRIPAFAAVDEAVGFLRRRRSAKIAGFANAVLRRLSREGEPAVVSLSENPTRHLVEAESLPEWLARKMIDELGVQEAVALARAQNLPASVVLRTNTRRITVDALIEFLHGIVPQAELKVGRLAPEAIGATGLGASHELGAYADGLFSVQDEAAQLVSHIVAPAAGWRVLDACAGVGTKSTHLATLMDNQGCVDAIDVDARRIARARAACERLGLSIVNTTQADLVDWPGRDYDAVLLDAPCSGLGVLRRHPEAKWRVVAEDLSKFGVRQEQLLAHAAERVRPGGVLVYSVCTFDTDETTAPVERFLKTHVGFTLEQERRTWPQRDGTDAFYIARLARAW